MGQSGRDAQGVPQTLFLFLFHVFFFSVPPLCVYSVPALASRRERAGQHDGRVLLAADVIPSLGYVIRCFSFCFVGVVIGGGRWPCCANHARCWLITRCSLFLGFRFILNSQIDERFGPAEASLRAIAEEEGYNSYDFAFIGTSCTTEYPYIDCCTSVIVVHTCVRHHFAVHDGEEQSWPPSNAPLFLRQRNALH